MIIPYSFMPAAPLTINVSSRAGLWQCWGSYEFRTPEWQPTVLHAWHSSFRPGRLRRPPLLFHLREEAHGIPGGEPFSC